MPKIKVKWITLLLFLVVGFTARAQDGQNVDSSVICRNKKEVRTLRIDKAEGGKCNAVYTKLGRDQNIGLASSEASCVEILRKVRVNLEAADWKCREAKESRVSNLNEM